MTAFDPYAVLGVPRDATPDAIRSAYRSAAAAAHPDRDGGSHEAMSEANEAYAILSDPARRQRFDTTGKAGAPSIENEAMTLFAQLLEKALEDSESVELDGLVLFIQRGANKILSEVRLRADSARELERRVARKIRKLKHKGEGENILAGMLAHKMQELRGMLERSNHGLKVASRVVKLAEQYEPDAAPPEPPFVRVYGAIDIKFTPTGARP